jgi:hypothetical protein
MFKYLFGIVCALSIHQLYTFDGVSIRWKVMLTSPLLSKNILIIRLSTPARGYSTMCAG